MRYSLRPQCPLRVPSVTAPIARHEGTQRMPPGQHRPPKETRRHLLRVQYGSGLACRIVSSSAPCPLHPLHVFAECLAYSARAGGGMNPPPPRGKWVIWVGLGSAPKVPQDNFCLFRPRGRHQEARWVGGWVSHRAPRRAWKMCLNAPPPPRLCATLPRTIIRILERMQGHNRQVAIATDSQCAYYGIVGAAWRWRPSGGVNQQGPVSNADLWMWLLHLVDNSSLAVRWIKVPSHFVVIIEGNSVADKLAPEKGRMGSPVYHSLSVRQRPVILPGLLPGR